MINAGHQKTSFEFHFQEGFRGEQIYILAGQVVLAQFSARTRFQTGLAHIEILELSDGEEVNLVIEELNLKTVFKVDVTEPFVMATIMDGNLRVEDTATRPGYL